MSLVSCPGVQTRGNDPNKDKRAPLAWGWWGDREALGGMGRLFLQGWEWARH